VNEYSEPVETDEDATRSPVTNASELTEILENLIQEIKILRDRVDELEQSVEPLNAKMNLQLEDIIDDADNISQKTESANGSTLHVGLSIESEAVAASIAEEIEGSLEDITASQDIGEDS